MLCVNVGSASLAAGTLADEVRAALARSGLPPEQLAVEVTERAVAAEPRRAIAQLADLRVSGVEVAVDDFGSGHTSLGQLVKLPAGVLKIDRGLVASVEGPFSQGAAAIAAVVGLGRACGMRTLAEGVETTQQFAVARELGCSYAQGWHIAAAMPPEQFLPWLTGRHVRVPGELEPAGR
jgi:EAL domain-containing protein (putative c-di-GMP-specific phosphodiesterase class I)